MTIQTVHTICIYHYYFTDDETLVGFTASKVNSEPAYVIEEPLIFESTLTNPGGAFDPSTGSFTCPVVGIYLVSITVQRYDATAISLDVLRTTFPIMQLFDSGAENEDAVINMSALTQCFPGEEIVVTPFAAGGIQGAGYPITTYMAILLYAF